MPTFHDPRDLARFHRRLRKARDAQAAYRDRLQAAGVPERDDLAAASLRAFVRLLAQRRDRDHSFVARILDAMPDRFDRAASERRLWEIVERERAALSRGDT